MINLTNPEDYHRLFSRPIWYVGNFVMRIIKWTTSFHVEKESSIVPAWIELEKLPIYLFNKEALFAIASRAGTPLRLDKTTEEICKPSVARIQVELDLLKPRPDMIWIEIEEEEGFWQNIKYINLPEYCDFCWHLGHNSKTCHVKNPDIRNLEDTTHQQRPGKEHTKLQTHGNTFPKNPANVRQEYRIKDDANKENTSQGKIMQEEEVSEEGAGLTKEQESPETLHLTTIASGHKNPDNILEEESDHNNAIQHLQDSLQTNTGVLPQSPEQNRKNTAVQMELEEM